MFTITAVCNAGIGTSAFCTGLIKGILDDLNYNKADIKIECVEVMAAKFSRCDVIVTQTALASRIPQGGNKPPVIGLASLVSGKEKMKEALAPYLEKAEAEGRIRKRV